MSAGFHIENKILQKNLIDLNDALIYTIEQCIKIYNEEYSV